MVTVVLVWDTGVALAFSREWSKRLLGRWVFRIEKVPGLLLAVFGILLAVD
jgi:threonine/homoserine/homoserine lactone efflux protein